MSEKEVFLLGERIYRDGILPSGRPLEAIVSGDVMVEGTMFSCVSCHLRSGLGSFEGQVFSPPVNGRSLFMAFGNMPEKVTYDDLLRFPAFIRPTIRKIAYTDKTLAEALRGGFSPSGRQFNDAMPRYLMSDDDMHIMIQYLNKLSRDVSPGVTQKEIRFATVISEEVSREDRDLLLTALKSVVSGYNTRPELVMRLRREAAQRRRAGHVTHEGEEDRTARNMVLEVWELKGPPETWRAQLEDYYQRKPVFGILSGMSRRDWAPVHDFCEKHGIPSLLPVTDHPVVSETDWYTLYISKGFFQEGEASARYLASGGLVRDSGQVVQVYRDAPAARSLAEGFRSAWEQDGRARPVEVRLSEKEQIDRRFWEDLLARHAPAAVMYWNPFPDIASLLPLADLKPGSIPVFVSHGLLKGNIYKIPEPLRAFTYIAYPYDINFEKRIASMEMPWFGQKISDERREMIAKIAALKEVLSDIFMEFDRYYYRDYLLDIVGMMQDKSATIPLYPRLSFGPGQRYAVKGCYVVRLGPGSSPRINHVSDWLVY